jgi:23S rRNA (guanosine2251-2'-O)-methyltransferase
VEDKELVFGRKPVLEYLRNASDGTGIELSLAQRAHGGIINAIVEEAKARNIPVVLRDKDFFSGLGPSSRHQGVVLKFPPAAGHPEDTAARLVEHAAGSGGVLVLLDRITDPRNAGAIIRTAEALGCSGIILPKSHASGITPAVVKASAGATAHIGIARTGNVSSFLDEAKAAGLWIIGADARGGTELANLGNVRPCIVVIGSEDAGMRHLTAEKCDYLVRIPLAGKISSLNASVAAGIVLYEIMQQ